MIYIEIDYKRVVRQMAETGLTCCDIDRKAKKKRSWCSQLMFRLRKRGVLAPATAKKLSKALGCQVSDLEPARAKEAA